MFWYGVWMLSAMGAMLFVGPCYSDISGFGHRGISEAGAMVIVELFCFGCSAYGWTAFWPRLVCPLHYTQFFTTAWRWKFVATRSTFHELFQDVWELWAWRCLQLVLLHLTTRMSDSPFAGIVFISVFLRRFGNCFSCAVANLRRRRPDSTQAGREMSTWISSTVQTFISCSSIFRSEMSSLAN